MLGGSMGGFQSEINKSRTDLEASSLDTSSAAGMSVCLFVWMSEAPYFVGCEPAAARNRSPAR